MIRQLCGFFGHIALRFPAPNRSWRIRCFCGMTDWIAPAEFFE